MVLSVSEELLNGQLDALWFMGIISRKWEYQGDLGSFTFAINSPKISITKSTKNTHLLKCSISFQGGSFTVRGQKYDIKKD